MSNHCNTFVQIVSQDSQRVDKEKILFIELFQLINEERILDSHHFVTTDDLVDLGIEL